jgi:preprotein translocase subunit YajC
MRLIHSLTALVDASTATTTKSTSSSSSSAFFLVIIVLFALLYFFLIRPNQRRRMQTMRQARTFDLGDEVVAGGMVGRVVKLGEGEVDIEIADGVVVNFVPQAVQLRSAYLAGPAGRGLGAGRAGLGAGGGGSSASGGTGWGSSSSSTGNGPGAGSSGAGAGGRVRSVRRRSTGSDSWPDASDNPVNEEDIDVDAGPSGANGTALSDEGVDPAGEDK